jgi:DivIVA domain-containing protein
VTSQGQRFRRRALRRGYKVDEVDAFLDRVEATLAGDPIGAPVSAQEVHDVVFRVRFGGYDEWQVDLHLDRVERQLGDLEERTGTGGFGRPSGLAALRGDSLGGRGDLRGDSLGGHEPLEPRRPSMPAPPMPQRPLSPAAQMSGPPMMGNGMVPPMMAPPPMSAPPMRPMSAPPMRPMSGPPMSAPPMRPMSAPPMRPMSAPPMSGPPMGHPMGGPGGPGGPGGYGRFDEPEYPTGGFGPDFGGRRGRMDMTHEMRFDLNGGPGGPGGMGGPGSSELQRIDAMRRTFTARRFGSGYDAIQVNRLFDAIIASLSGRSNMPLNESELDPNQFSLVPGGYFEAEVNQALREVRDLVRR